MDWVYSVLLLLVLLPAASPSNAQQRFDNKTWSQPEYQAVQDFYMSLPGAGVESYSYRPDGSGICLRDDVNMTVTGFGLDCDEIAPGYTMLEYDGSNTLSPNVIDNNAWDGATYGNDPGGCCSSISGNGALYDQSTDTIMFSYGRDILAQTIAINQALAQSGIQLDGLSYGWTWRRIGNNGRDGDILQFDVEVKDSSGAVVERYSYDRSDGSGYGTTDQWTTEEFLQAFGTSYLDPSSASIRITGQDGGYWGGYYGPEVKDVNLQFIYRADPCAANPLYDPSCEGYGEAYAEQEYNNNCTADPMYDPGCPGYQQAYEQQQCNADPLYSPSCSGYQQAYYEQQCSADPLYDSGCPGYEQAYYDQQCSADPFYDTNCPGYASAYYDQQCSADPLYDSGCPGYQSAYYDQQCGIDPLYDSGCPGYQSAYYDQQCSVNALYDSGCPGYEQAYYDNQCSLNPLYDTGCNGYADAFYAQQCGLDALYDTQCPGYAVAYYDQQCGLDALYDAGCSGYQAAYYDKYIKPGLDKQAEQAAGVSNDDASSTATNTTVDAQTAEDPVAALTQPSATGDSTVDEVLRGTNNATTNQVVDRGPAISIPAPQTERTVATNTPRATQERTTKEESQEEQMEQELVALVETEGKDGNEKEVSESRDNVDERMDSAGDKTSDERKEPSKEDSKSDSEGDDKSGESDSGDDSKEEGSQESGKKKEMTAEEKQKAKRKKMKEIATKRAMALAETMGAAATLEAQQALQAQIAALINFVPGFNAYGQVGIPGGDIYADQAFYADEKVPENQRGLRNGLAQQLLHQEMVDLQYEKMK